MNRIFNVDSPLMRFLNRVGDLLILNFLTLIFCIPIITIGASYTAMYYVLIKIVRNEEGYLIKSFWKSFRQNVKQAIVLWLIMLVAIIILGGDVLIFLYSGISFPKPLVIALVVLAIILYMILQYVFPILSRFELSTKDVFKNAALLSFASLPKTIAMALISVVPLAVGYFIPRALPLVVVFGISGPAYACSLFYSGIFKQIEPKEEEAEEAFEIPEQ